MRMLKHRWPRPPAPTRAAAMEADFIARRRHPAQVATAFQEAMAMLAPGLGPLHAAGRRIARAAGRPGGTEPAYHNRHHVVETVLAMGALCRTALALGLLPGRRPVRAALCGVVAMAGHDLHHDGSIEGGGVLEARSARAVAALMGGALADRAPVCATILATDPARVAANARHGPVLHRLANEADVFASLLPGLGPHLSRDLAREWRGAPDPALRQVGTARARLAFLRAYPALSPAAAALGLEAARHRSIAAYAAAAALLDAGAGAEAGCAALDALPAAAAQAAYQAALHALGPTR